MIIYSGYLMWKRQRPILFSIKLMDCILLLPLLLLLSHITLFELLSNGDRFENPSVMANTWELFMNGSKR